MGEMGTTVRTVRPKVAVIGATGQLGGDLVEVFEDSGRWEVVGLSHEDVEVTRPESVETALEKLKPSVVINTAAFNRVDACETEVESAFRVNALGVLHVARAADRVGALCVYVSTDYVFDGRRVRGAGSGHQGLEAGRTTSEETRGGGCPSTSELSTEPAPYTEHDRPNPINIYGASKLAGEVLTAQGAARYLVVRVASLFGRRGARGKGGNFVTTILARAKAGEPLRVVDDIVMSPTYTRDAARAIERLVRAGVTGVVHVVNSGMCSWYQFACAIVRLAGLDVLVEPVSSQAYPAAAKRPAFSALSNRYAATLVGHELFRPWEDAVADYLRMVLL